MTKEISLFVNDGPIALDYFIQGYIDRQSERCSDSD